jgi:glycosyltransferase involved in cell wall biosynthesis
MTRVPTVSVVVPCYNYGRYLPSCIESIVSQTGVETRVLIIDDTSTDDSAEVGRALAEKYDNVEFRRHEVNQGHIATYNEGLLEWADGDYVSLLSADDELTPGSLARSVEIMEAHPRVGMVYGGIEEFGEGIPRKVSSVGRPGSIVYDGHSWLKKRSHQAVNVVPTPGTTLRTSVQREVGGYDPLLTHAGDFEMWLRVAAISDIGYVRGLPQGRYRLHSASMSYGVYQDRFGDVAQRKLVFDAMFRRYPAQMAQAGIQPDVVYSRMASQALRWASRFYEKSSRPDLTEVQRSVDFAAEAYPAYRELPRYRALRRRQRLGAPFCHRTQIFVFMGVVQRVRDRYWWFRWRRYGG